jgi:hypothetical protein
VDPFTHVIDAWLRVEPLLKATVMHERLVEQYRFAGNYQRVTLLAGLHRRFDVVPFWRMSASPRCARAR